MARAVSTRRVHRSWNVSAPGANTDAITNVTWPSDRACRVSIQVGTATVVNLMVSRSATEFALGLNGNVALQAGALYVFDVFSLEKDDTVNVQVETDSAINTFALDEIL